MNWCGNFLRSDGESGEFEVKRRRFILLIYCIEYEIGYVISLCSLSKKCVYVIIVSYWKRRYIREVYCFWIKLCLVF